MSDMNDKLREMVSQKQLIEQKKREIQSKLAEASTKREYDKPHSSTALKSDSMTASAQKPAFIGKMFGKNRFQFAKTNTDAKSNSKNKTIEDDIFENDGFSIKDTNLNPKISFDAKLVPNANEKVNPAVQEFPDAVQSVKQETQNFTQNLNIMAPPVMPAGIPPMMSHFAYPQGASIPGYQPFPFYNPQYHNNFSQHFYATQLQPPPPPPPPPPAQSALSIAFDYNENKSVPMPLMSLKSTADATRPTDTRAQHNLDDEYETFLMLTGQKEIKNESYEPSNDQSESRKFTHHIEKANNETNSININVKKLIDQTAKTVAINGIAYESEMYKDKHKYWWLKAFESNEFNYYKKCLDKELSMKIEKSLNNIEADYKFQCDQISKQVDEDLQSKKRKSRWTNESTKNRIKSEPGNFDDVKPERSGFGYIDQSSKVKTEPDNIDNDFMKQVQQATARARNIADQINEQISLYPEGYISNTNQVCEQQKQVKEQKDLQAIFEKMMEKRKAIEKIAKEMKFKYEYDSDEEVDPENGTWEHTLRKAEMEATKQWAGALTEMADGKHHIGDFLPPSELSKFMSTYQALKEGRTPDFSDYKEFKINAENLGFKLLQKLGWKEGQGLGKQSQGITAPVNKGVQSIDHAGLGGVEKPDTLSKDDDDFSMYRKRMMLAYKFRPNPLNNPRRPY